MELYKKASEAEPPVANAFYYLGVVLEKQREHRRSQALFKQCLNLDQEHFGASVRLATDLANQSEMVRGRARCQHATMPSWSKARNHRYPQRNRLGKASAPANERPTAIGV